MNPTEIQWCDMVWNPIRGCTKISTGCKYCYAERQHARTSRRPFTEVQLFESKLIEPLRMRNPRRIFVNSMSDLFHNEVPFDFIDGVFLTMLMAPHHQFIVLTRRAQRMREYLLQLSDKWGVPPKHIAVGVSVENQDAADERIPYLVESPAITKIISAEPLIGPVEIEWLPGIDWLIAGGESGPHARPMHPDWARSLRNQCEIARVPFFFKQWGEFANADSARIDLYTCHETAGSGGWLQQDGRWTMGDFEIGSTHLFRIGKKAAGRLLDGEEYSEIPYAWRQR